MKNLKNKSGFTLVETIVGISLGILVTSMIMTIVVSGLKHIQIIKKNENLHSNAVFLLNMISYWVKQGNGLSAPTPSTLEIRLPDHSTTTITKTTDNKITINGNVITPDDIEVDALNFTKMTRSVRINFTIKTKGSEETLAATTTIAQRNNP